MKSSDEMKFETRKGILNAVRPMGDNIGIFSYNIAVKVW